MGHNYRLLSRSTLSANGVRRAFTIHSRATNAQAGVNLAYHHLRLGDIKNSISLRNKFIPPSYSYNSDSHPNSIVSLLFLHCLLGSRHSFRLLSHHLHNYLAEENCSIDAYYLDMRNHGDSPHNKVHTYDAMCIDILEWLQKRSINIENCVFIGHSMGARVAMAFALDEQYRLHNNNDKNQSNIKGLISLDASPVSYLPSHNHAHIFTGMKTVDLHSLPLPPSPRVVESSLVPSPPVPLISSQCHKMAEKAMVESVPIKPERSFILENLRPTEFIFNKPHYTEIEKNDLSLTSPPSYSWTVNLPILSSHESNIHTFPSSSSFRPFNFPTLFIGGKKSTRLTYPPYLEPIHKLFPSSSIQMVEGGHFVHQGEANTTAKLIMNYLKQINLF